MTVPEEQTQAAALARQRLHVVVYLVALGALIGALAVGILR
ncbi:hypothetical protein [Streptomyces sp. NPDC057250]